MQADQILLKLAQPCGLKLEAAKVDGHDPIKTIAVGSCVFGLELTHTMQVRSSQYLVALNFMVAGSDHYFLPAKVESSSLQDNAATGFVITNEDLNRLMRVLQDVGARMEINA